MSISFLAFKIYWQVTLLTNQMNFSGNRYTIEELKLLNSNKHYKIMLISASDKFGDYGIVGLVSYL